MSYDGVLLSGLFRAGAQSLQRERDHINKINTFPVPDGDSGTNMLYTMSAAASAVDGTEPSASKVAQKAARAALLSARGNSGIILSQIMAGLGRGLKEKDTFTARDLAAGLESAVELAYRSVAEPVEGTILTVVKRVSETAKALSHETEDLFTFLDGLTQTARKTLAETPKLLARLRETGVVDAGGLGFCIILEAMRDEARTSSAAGGEALLEAENRGVSVARGGWVEAPIPVPGSRYGYEVQYLVYGKGLDLDALRKFLATLGDSVLVVGDEDAAKVHVHTLTPQMVVDWASSTGDLDQLTFENLDEQAGEFLGH